MKILCCIDSLGSGGAQNQATLLGCKLKDEGFQVEFFTYFENDFFIGVSLPISIIISPSPS